MKAAGALLRKAAKETALQEEAARARVASSVTPLKDKLQGALQSPQPPQVPDYGTPPALRFTPTYPAGGTQLADLFPGSEDGISPLALQFQFARQKGQMPGQADFARANALGEAAGAKGSLDTLFPNGFEPTPYEPISLPGLQPRDVPRYPERPAPGNDWGGSLLGAIAGFIDPVGAGQYNAGPLQAAARVANQQYEDRLRQFENAVLNANNAYNDARTERNAQYDVARDNQSQQNALRQFDQGRREKYAGLVGDRAGSTAYADALNPLAERGAQATEGAAMGSFLNDYLDRAMSDQNRGNEVAERNWRNQFDLSRTRFGDEMGRFEATERVRNNNLDLMGALLRPSFDPSLSLKQDVLRSQIGVNEARRQDLLKGGAGTDPEAMRLRALSTAIRIAMAGEDPSAFGLPSMPGIMAQQQTIYQQRATSLQMRDPRIRVAENDLKQRVLQRDILFRDYQQKYSAKQLSDPAAFKSYTEALARADREIGTYTKKRDEALKGFNTAPRTPGVSTGVPKPTPKPDKVKAAPTKSVSNAKQSGGKKRIVYDPATGNFR